MAKKRFGHKKAPKIPQHKKKITRQGKHRHNGEPEDDSNSGTGAGTGRGGDSGRLLTNPNTVNKDLRLLNRAVRSGWNIRRKNMIKRRLESVLLKETVSVPTKNGMVEVDGPADSNAIAAARVLVAMNGQDQADDHLAMKVELEAQANKGGVNVNIDARESTILQLAKSLGATELIIDGSSVPVAEGAGQPKEAGAVQPQARESVVRESALAKARAILEP